MLGINKTEFWETGKSKLNPRDCTRNKTEKYMSKLPVYGWSGNGTTPLKARGGGVAAYNGLYGEAPPERGTFIRLQVYERGVISLVDKSLWKGRDVCHFWQLKGPKGIADAIYGCEKTRKRFGFVI